MKTKIAITLFIIFAISAFTIYILFENTLKVNFNPDKNHKLILVSETLTKLYENEIIGRNESIKNYPGLITYVNNIDSLIKKVDCIAKLSQDTLQIQQVKALKRLFQQKKEYATVLYNINRQLKDSTKIRSILKDIEQIKDSIYTHVTIDTTVTEIIDSSYIIENRKGGFLNLFNRPEKQLVINKQKEIKTDTIVSSNRDSLPVFVERTISSYIRKDSTTIAGLRKTETQIITNDKRIGNQIASLLAAIEKEEFNATIYRIEQHNLLINRTVNLITIIAAISIVIVLLFIYSTFKEISASNRYRRQLEQEKLHSERLLHYREKLIYTLTHDIKTPLSSLLGYITLTRDLHPQKRIENYLNNMELSANTISELVTNLLDYSRLENNTLTIQHIPFDPQILFHDLEAIFQPLAQQKQIELHFYIDKQITDQMMESDPFRIKQIVSNLISNAIKFTSTGGVTIRASVADKFLTITISDTGKGIATHELENIFKSFYQLQDGKVQQNGTGLGLNICKGVTKLLHGDIRVHSIVGKGSDFTVYIPYKAVLRPKPIEHSERTRHVLIVDDDPIQGEMLKEFLHTKEVSTVYLQHPTQIIEILRKESFDFLFTDIQMPEMNGFTLLKTVREAGFNLPVIAMSGNATIVEKAQQEGFMMALPKPFQPNIILSIIRNESSYINNTALLTEPLKAPYGIASLTSYCDDRDAILEVLNAFIIQTEKDVELLKQKNSEQNKRTAHRMLVMARQLQLFELIPHLEQSEKSGDINPSFFTAWQIIRTHIEEWIHKQ